MLGGPARDGFYSAWCWAGLMCLALAMHAPAPREEWQLFKNNLFERVQNPQNGAYGEFCF
jgi:hypothetical protein